MRGQPQGLQLGGQAEAVDQTENQPPQRAVVGVKAKHPHEAAEIVERLVDDRQADHRVHQIRIDVGQHARSRVTPWPRENIVT